MNTSKSHQFALPIGLGLVAWIVFVRLLPYILFEAGAEDISFSMLSPWNFSPVMAIGIFAMARLNRDGSRWLPLVFPLGGMLVSDAILLLWKGPAFALYASQPFVYGCFALGACLGLFLRSKGHPLRIAGTGVAAEVLFFAITNLAVWMITRGTPPMNYAMGPNGLVQCYVAGLPFMLRSLVSTLVYSAVLFEAWNALTQSTNATVAASVAPRDPVESNDPFAPPSA